MAAVAHDGNHLPRGTRLGSHYTVSGVLRDDGGSFLYSGRSGGAMGAPVMIKEVVADGFVSPENRANAQSRFWREVQVLQELKHPALPVVLDAFSAHSRHYLVMKYCPGEALEVMLARRGRPFAGKDVIGWALEILSALGVMHRHDPPVIYRNLKPSNIIIDPTGTLRLLDFGLARFYTQGKRHDTEALGAAGYAPPEQIRGATDPRSDLYSLGVTMHYVLTNQHPAQQPSPVLPPVTSNPAVSAELAAIVARAVDPEPGRRWPSAAEMEMALRRHALALTATRPHEVEGPPAEAAPAYCGARLVITAARPSGSRDEVLHHLRRLTWMTHDDLASALAGLPVVLPLVEPYKASLSVLKGLGLEARPVWPLRGLHALDGATAAILATRGRVEIDNPAACEDGVCLCRYCHFGWMVDPPDDSPPLTCPSCWRAGWNTTTLLHCHWCGHEYEEPATIAPCPCCELA